MPTPADYAEMAAHRVLPDGRGALVYPQAFGTARMLIGPVDSAGADDSY